MAIRKINTIESATIKLAPIPNFSGVNRVVGPPAQKQNKGRALLIVGIATVAFVIIVLIFTVKWRNEQPVIQENILVDIKKHFLLPSGEEPTLAMITNAQELTSQQPFFSRAINGDILLLFAQSGQALIYSPERDLVVNVGPIKFAESNNLTKK